MMGIHAVPQRPRTVLAPLVDPADLDAYREHWARRGPEHLEEEPKRHLRERYGLTATEGRLALGIARDDGRESAAPHGSA